MAYNLLKGKKGIIFGALDEKSIAWKTALRCHEEGAQLVLTNAPVALRMGEINKLAEAVNAPVIGADVTNMDDLKKLFEESFSSFSRLSKRSYRTTRCRLYRFSRFCWHGVGSTMKCRSRSSKGPELLSQSSG